MTGLYFARLAFLAVLLVAAGAIVAFAILSDREKK